MTRSSILWSCFVRRLYPGAKKVNKRQTWSRRMELCKLVLDVRATLIAHALSYVVDTGYKAEIMPPETGSNAPARQCLRTDH